MAARAYAPNTLRAWRADWAVFESFCRREQQNPLPADPLTVRLFVFDCLNATKRPATIRRYLATIARAHRATSQPDPCDSEAVHLALKEMGRAVPARQRQARGLIWRDIERFLAQNEDSLRYSRDRALVCVAYDTMCRRDELVSLRVQDVTIDDTDGSATILIRRSKTDTAGEGATAYLSPLTVRHFETWLERASITEGPLFYRLTRTGVDRHPLNAQSVAHIFKRIARWLGHSLDDISRTSGHSIRVGAAQDLLALNIDLASVMQAGRWKDTRMPMRYGERVLAKRGGMARAAKEQGRT